MAEDYHGYFQRRADERAAARAEARPAPAAVVASGATPSPAEETRGAGTLTKYRPVGGWRNPGETQAAPNLAELGEPTSFAGGAGAPESIGVIRGMKQTFAPAAQPGDQFIEGEYNTRLQAGQAYNRVAAARDAALGISPGSLATLHGEYRAPGQTIAEIQAEREGPETGKLRALQTRGRERQEAEAERTARGTRFSSLYRGQVGTPPKPDEATYPDYADALAHAQEHGERAGMDRLTETKRFRTLEPLMTPEVLKTLGYNLPPNAKEFPEQWRKTVLSLGPKAEAIYQKIKGTPTGLPAAYPQPELYGAVGP